MQKFFVLSLSGLSSDDVDLVSGELFEHGATGLHENLPFRQEGEFYEVTPLDLGETTLMAYFDHPPDPKLLAWLKEHFPEVTCLLAEEESKDWLSEWKKGFDSFPLVSGIYVVPSWKEVPPMAKAAIKIDPGMAFGTGTHETTQLASELIATLDFSKINSVLDVGTGTGILAFLCEILGAKELMGLEIDVEARRTARENALVNSSCLQVPDFLIEEVNESFDFVIANIIDGVLVRIQDYLKKCVKPGGYLLLTGILDERDLGFRQRFSFNDFELLSRATKGEWVGYLLRSKC